MTTGLPSEHIDDIPFKKETPRSIKTGASSERERDRVTIHRKDIEANRRFMLEFYEQYRGFLFHTAWKYTQSKNDCDDLIQDVMVRLMRNADTLRELSHNQRCVYIHLTVRSIYADRIKSSQTLQFPVADTDLERLGSSREPQEDWVDVKWDIEILKSRLPEKDWRLLELKYIAGLSDTEIASEIGCTPASVRTLLLRVRGRARELLGGSTGKG